MSNVLPLTRPTHRATPWPDTITVIAWPDPVIEHAPGAIATTSDDFLTWWTNTLGPSSVLVARYLAIYAADGETEWPLDELGPTFGLGRSQLCHALDRLGRFAIVARHGYTVAVRLMVGPLSQRQLDRMPRYLADAYQP